MSVEHGTAQSVPTKNAVKTTCMVEVVLKPLCQFFLQQGHSPFMLRAFPKGY
jgi:hypothetical protein